MQSPSSLRGLRRWRRSPASRTCSTRIQPSPTRNSLPRSRIQHPPRRRKPHRPRHRRRRQQSHRAQPRSPPRRRSRARRRHWRYLQTPCSTKAPTSASRRRCSVIRRSRCAAAGRARQSQARAGASGPEVAKLRRRLVITDDLPAGGSRRRLRRQRCAEAVKRFQIRHGLEATGSVGPQTIARPQRSGRRRGSTSSKPRSNGCWAWISRSASATSW